MRLIEPSRHCTSQPRSDQNPGTHSNQSHTPAAGLRIRWPPQKSYPKGFAGAPQRRSTGGWGVPRDRQGRVLLADAELTLSVFNQAAHAEAFAG
ncbi:hypothetical protein, partial [Micromonospora chalcea]|uniref:hypothetical protein n=1 Tax=Micromonospora chalcea TaxID=1874 RepID=UPI003F4D5708